MVVIQFAFRPKLPRTSTTLHDLFDLHGWTNERSGATPHPLANGGFVRRVRPLVKAR